MEDKGGDESAGELQEPKGYVLRKGDGEKSRRAGPLLLVQGSKWAEKIDSCYKQERKNRGLSY